MAEIRQPSLQELIAALSPQGTPVDINQIGDRAIKGMDLQNTILTRRQAQEDRERTLREKIDQIKRQRALSEAVKSGISPVAGLAADVDPNQASRQILEKEFTERQAKQPKQPTYTKIGETADEIILADMADPSKTFRIKAPGVGNKGGKASDPAAGQRRELSRADNVIIASNKALENIKKYGRGSSGIGGITQNLPETPARNLKAFIEPIKANLGFQELEEMRKVSPTGGALGQIAVRELDFLQSVRGSLDQLQDPAQLETTITAIRDSFQRLKDAIEKGQQQGSTGAPTATPQAGGSGLSPEQRRARIAELKAKQAQGTLQR